MARFDEMIERCYPSSTAESAALLDEIGVFAWVENRAAAAQLEAIGRLFGYRLSRCAETEEWAIDTMEAVAAEVGAALRISQGLAASRLRYARGGATHASNLKCYCRTQARMQTFDAR